MDIQDKVFIFCENVRRRRENAGLSLLELSQRSGIRLKLLESLDQGRLPHSLMVADASSLAKVFGCDISDLFQ